jgi:large subunit ribosomal protein L1
MAKAGKRYHSGEEKLDPQKKYTLAEAVAVLAQMPKAKFDETVDLSVRLGVDPKQADQMVRGSVQLPHGTGKKVRVVVFAKGEKEQEARDAGADEAGSDDLVKKVQGGWLDFDRAVATPDMMSQVGKLGQILGPRGLMPNPKSGTVTFDVKQAVSELKAGKVDYRVDKGGVIHTVVGKASFPEQKLAENLAALMESIVKAKPATSKGVYLRSVAISTTMGPGVRLDPGVFMGT